MQKLSTTTAHPPGAALTLFANPIAGRGRGESIARRLIDRLVREGFTPHLFLERPDTIARETLTPHGIATVVIGGDGTLRAVIERFYMTGSNLPPLLVVPLGTANLMGKHLGMKWNNRNVEDVVINALRAARVIQMDCASANGHPLIVMAGIGFDADVVQEVARRRRGPIRYLSYVIPTLLTFANYTFPEIEVVIDDQHAFGPAPGLAFVGNIREYGTGFAVLPQALGDDQLLDVCVLPCAGKTDLVKWAALAATGFHPTAKGVVYRKAKRVRITSPSGAPVQVDGEDAGTTPLDIQLLPHAVPFVLPAGQVRGEQ